MSQQVSVVLGPTYPATMWDLRKRVSAARRAGEQVIFVRLSAPINSDVVEVAILSSSLYLIGVRGQHGFWHEFLPDDRRGDPTKIDAPKPRLPGSRWVTRGGHFALSSYRGLGLEQMLRKEGSKGCVVFSNTPLELVRFLHQWNGSLSVYTAQLNVLMLVFILCEALRFRSIENACAGFIWPRGGRSDDPILQPSFTITLEMYDLVQNWAQRARGKGEDPLFPDVQTWPPHLPDKLIS